MKRLRRKPKPEKVEKPKPAYDPNLGSGYTPGRDGLWLAPDWVREGAIEDIGTDGYHHWVPRRRN